MRNLIVVAAWFFAALCLVNASVAAEQPVARLAPLDKDGATFRLYDGFTMLVHNPEGKAFKLTLDVRDLNLFEPGPREVLFKVYDPSGKAVVREIVPDDGVTTPPGDAPTGGWDHEGWYFLYHYNRGVAPMLKWSALSAPDRLGAVPVRTFERAIPAGEKGVYRVVVVGARDHVVTAKVDSNLKWAVGGNPFFLHPVGNLLKKRFVYVPKGALGLNIAIVEHDRPRRRKFTLKDEAGNVLAEGVAQSGVEFAEVSLKAPGPKNPDVPAHLQPGALDDKVLAFELSDGPNTCMVQFSIQYPRLQGITKPLPAPVAPAFYAPDIETAKALRGGAVEADGKIYWQPLQAKLIQWLNKLKPEDFEIKNADGTPAKQVTLSPPGAVASPAYDITPNRNAEYISLNGVHEKPPISDTIMFSYDMHRNKQSLNVALRDTINALADMGPGDHVMNATWKGMSNLAYENGTYRYHWWRPAWRIIKEKDTPAEVRDAMREMIIHSADRIAFCRNWERVNGNAFTTVLCALRYAEAATDDALTKELCEDFYKKFTTGGFGDRVGVGPSGPVQEEFAYDNHYGSYPVATTRAVIADFNDPRFVKINEGLLNFYSYAVNTEVSANPFSARTAHNPDSVGANKEGKYAWKGYPGPDLTESINNANEFFAARRQNYYMLSYHGRMTPKWEGESFRGQMGWSGGVLCQFVIPGKGTVLASTMDAPGYGTNMHPSQWRSFRIHSIVGMTTDGKPLVAADGEHNNARLAGNTVTGSGEVRDSSVNATRSYTYNADHVLVEAKLRMTDDDKQQAYWFQSPFRGCLAEAWEMIPFMAHKGRGAKAGDANTTVKVLDAAGKEVGDLKEELSEGQTLVIDRGGFGVRIELEKPMKVKRGAGNTVMIKLVEGMPMGPRDDKAKPNVDEAAIKYKIVPFNE